jgi:hypothetical protein
MRILKQLTGGRSAFWTILFLATCVTARAQMVYQVSVYNDASSDGTTIFAVSTTVDSSTGCSAHGSYTTTAKLIAPNGTQAPTATPGFVSHTSMAINGLMGNYTAVSTVQFYCGCFGRNVGGGGISIPIDIGDGITGFTDGVPAGVDGCYYRKLACLMDSVPSCPSGASWGATSGCSAWWRVTFIKATFFNTITECFPIGLGEP